MENPFYLSGIIPERWFCDREKETEWLTKTLVNGANVLLSSPRRMGKTQLIYHLFQQPEVRDNYYCFYTDIFPTSSLQELVLFLGKEICSALVPKGKSALDKFLSAIRSLSGSFTYDPVSGSPSFDVKLGDIHSPMLTIEEIFAYLEGAGKPCIFAIDEFQQIAAYPEKNVEALLRSYIQKMNNCRFVFAGSNRHVLERMFNSAAKPFYNSAQQLYLDRIPEETYIAFAVKAFRESGRNILPESVSYIYRMFDGHTYYVHNILHNAIAYLGPEKTVDSADTDRLLSDILDEKGQTYAGMMNQLNYQQKEVIVAIARERKAKAITSVAFIKKHSLKSPSSVQYAVAQLLEQQLITYENEGRNKVFSLTDRFMQEWIRKVY